MTLYDDLGVPKDIDTEKIKSIFRTRAKETHPDKGGDPAQFRNLVRAYNILSDPDKRRRYDNGENPESINQSNSAEHQALGMVYTIFNSIIDQDIDLTHSNLFEIMQSAIKSNQENIKNHRTAAKIKIEKYQNILNRIKKNDKSQCFIDILQDKIKKSNGQIIEMDTNLKICDIALKLIEGCGYQCETQTPIRYSFFSTSTTTSNF